MGFGKGKTSKGITLSVMAHLKRSIVEVNAKKNCPAHALLISVARVRNYHNHLAYRKWCKILPKVRELL